MLFLVNLVLVLVSAFFFMRLTKIQQRVAFLLGIYILGYANVVLIEELAGLFSVLNWKIVFSLQIVYTLIACFLWMKFAGGGFSWHFKREMPRLILGKIWEKIKAYPEIVALGIGVGIVYLLGAGMILVIPPDNYDSMTYHLSRVGYWLQYHSLYPWPTINVRQTTFPMNVELGTLWTILWWGKDQLAGFVQWMGAITIVLSIYGMVRVMGYSRIAGVTTALLFPTLTQVLFQSTTTQNDLTTAALWSCVTFFYFAGIKLKNNAYFTLSAIAFGLAMGAKSTSLIMLPAWLLVLGVSYVRDRHTMFVPLKIWILTSFVSTLFLGSYIYIQNQVVYGGPLGPGERGSGAVGLKRGTNYRFELLRDNVARYGYQLVDFSPLPSALSLPSNLLKQEMFTSIYGVLHIPVEENMNTMPKQREFRLDRFTGTLTENDSWFGPLTTFLIISIVAQLIRWKNSKYEVAQIAPLILFFGFLFLHSAAQKWTPAKGRYYMIPIALSFPAMAVFFSFYSERVNRIFRIVFVLLGLTSMFFVRFGPQDSMTILPNIRSLQRRPPSWERQELVLKYINRMIPPDSDIGFAPFNADSRDYPLFGENFMRKVYFIPHDFAGRFLNPFQEFDYVYKSRKIYPVPRKTDGSFFEASQQIDYIYLDKTGTVGKKIRIKALSSENYSLILEGTPLFSVWARNDIFPKLNSCKRPQWPLDELFLIDQRLRCVVWAQFPLISPSETPTIDLVNDPDAGFQVHLFSVRNLSVTLKFKMTSLRSEAADHQINIRLLQDEGEYYSTMAVVGNSPLTINVDLPKGESVLDIHLVAPPLPKGKVPLQLIRIERISVDAP